MRFWLKEIRKMKKLTQIDISEKTQIKQATYCNIENGRRDPSVSLAKRIGEVLHLNWTLFYEENAS